MDINAPSAVSTQSAYLTGFEHLADELTRLDLLIHLHVLKQRKPQPANLLDQFRGLVLTEQEISELLSGVAGPSTGDDAMSSDAAKVHTLLASLRRLESSIGDRRAASLKAGIYLPLPRLAQIFHLSRFEEQCLLIALGPELDRKYEKLYAYLHDDVTRKKATVDLVLNLLCPTVQEKIVTRLVFNSESPLLKHRLLQITDSSSDGPAPLLSRFLKLDDRIVNFLLGFEQLDARLDSFARLVCPRRERNKLEVSGEVVSRMLAFTRSHFNESEPGKENLILHFHGPYGSGKRSLAEAVCEDIGTRLLVADVEEMLNGQVAFGEIIWLLGREAVLQSVAVCLENFDVLLKDDDKCRAQLRSLLEAARVFVRLTLLLGHRPWKPQGLLGDQDFISLELPIPDDNTRRRLWETRLSGYCKVGRELDLGALASKFRFTPGQIDDAVAAARNLARWREPKNGNITLADLHDASCAQSNPKLGALARKIAPKYTWDDIVLPPDQLAQLREICNQAKYRHIVYGEWRFARKLSLGKGLIALFSGPPGTGKTMAAEVIATELHLDLYQIDLSQVVSKYIGETEKNLHQIFLEAQRSSAILFFDEADALFGKRSEVKDAHDRYANIEIGYLLQKMEEYEGIAILATNVRHHMDEAFMRRIHVIIEFPFPDEQYRRHIWEVMFPVEAPVGEEVDLGLLAREIRLAGGNIKNIALAAAFYAAANGEVIRMPHLLQAARREHQKLGRIWDRGEHQLRDASIS
jgi:AAA+ superfamily predicted ATPase